MQIDEKLIEQLTKALKDGSDISVWKKNRKLSPLLTLLSQLNSAPKISVPQPDFMRARNQILDRISVPSMEAQPSWFASMFPRMLKISISAIGSLLIISSLALGTAVAALQAVPGDAIYPLKKVVENIELKLSPSDQRASLQLKFADNRIEEIQQVLENQSLGKVSSAEAQKVISQTVKDLQKNTNAAVQAPGSQKVVNKLADLNNKLKTASIQSEGQVKVELEKALEATRISQSEAIKNMEHAGLKVENDQIIIDDSVSANGKLTAVTETSISLGTAKFLINKDTQYVGLKVTELKAGLVVDIEGQIKDNKAYASKVTLISETKTQEPTEKSTNSVTP